MGTQSVYIVEETMGSCWWQRFKESDVDGDHRWGGSGRQ